MAAESPTYKIVLLGDTGVGKSSVASQFVQGQFKETTDSTIGASFLTKSVTLDGKATKLHVWDTAGQEKYRSIASMYYRNAAAAIVVFDLAREASFATVKYWVGQLKQNVSGDIVLAIVGNKSDLPNRKIDAKKVRAYVSESKALYFETSAKNNTNIAELFMQIAREAMARDNGADESASKNPMSPKLQIRNLDEVMPQQQPQSQSCCGKS